MRAPASDDELAARQSALQAEAAALLDELDRSDFSDIGPPEVTGSYISNLMCWRELDVGLLVGADYSPRDVLRLISRLMEPPGAVGFNYRDERGDRRTVEPPDPCRQGLERVGLRDQILGVPAISGTIATKTAHCGTGGPPIAARRSRPDLLIRQRKKLRSPHREECWLS